MLNTRHMIVNVKINVTIQSLEEKHEIFHLSIVEEITMESLLVWHFAGPSS